MGEWRTHTHTDTEMEREKETEEEGEAIKWFLSKSLRSLHCSGLRFKIASVVGTE